MRIVCLLAVLAAACNSGDVIEGSACTAGSVCPAGYTCDTRINKCYKGTAGGFDAQARIVDAAIPDAPVLATEADAAPDAQPAIDAPIAVDAIVPDGPVTSDPDAAASPDAGLPDAPAPPDAAIGPVDARPPPDAPPPPDANLPPITVTVFNEDGTLVNGADVVFHDPAGNAVATAKTDVNGKSTHWIIPGGAVTVMRQVVNTSGNDTTRTTIFAVMPSDDLVVRPFSPGETTTPTTDPVTVQLPAPDSRAQGYSANLGCASSATSSFADIVVDVPRTCRDSAGKVNVLGAVSGFGGCGRDNEPSSCSVSFSWLTGITPPATVTLGAWTDASTTVTLAPAPTTVGSTGLQLYGRMNGHFYYIWDSYQSIAGTPFTFPAPVGFGDSHILAVNRSEGQATSRYAGNFAGALPASATFDMTKMLPMMSAASLSSTTNLARPRLTWTGSVTSAMRGGVATIRWSAPTLNKRPEVITDDGDWTFVFPTSMAGSITAPAIPDALGGYRPQVTSADSFFVTTISLREDPRIGSYGELRATYQSPPADFPTGNFVIREVTLR